jgi:hypothetical protein
MKKYFALATGTGDLRLSFIGKFDGIGEAIYYADSRFSNLIWVLAEEDFQLLVKDYESCKTKWEK